MEGAEDGAAQTAARLQLLQTLNRVRCCSLLPPADKRGNRYRYMCVRIKIKTSDLVTKKIQLKRKQLKKHNFNTTIYCIVNFSKTNLHRLERI